jgi:tRNA threonylcarbamoyladenosine modification (KEOPS) complex  Pcc1 subunit
MTLAGDRAELRLRTGDAAVVARALSPELSERIPRTSVAIEALDGEVIIRVEADDRTALRAALNSYIRWASVAEDTAEEARK